MSSMLCPVCQTGRLNEHSVGSTRMLRCDQCTVVVTPPEGRATRSSDYYANEYSLTKTVRISTELHRYFRYPEYIRLIGEVKQFADAPARWLDIGCDHGFFLDDVRRYGYTTHGVEPSAAARQYAHHIGLDVVPDVCEVQGPFDVVSMWHVLEHIAEPAEYLGIIRSKMPEGGILTLRVPDAESWWSRVLRDKWIWFQPHHHCIQFNKIALERLLTKNGFDIITIRAQKPNTRLTRKAFRLAHLVFSSSRLSPVPSLRDRLARMYQDVTGSELFVIAKARQ